MGGAQIEYGFKDIWPQINPDQLIFIVSEKNARYGWRVVLFFNMSSKILS